MTARTRALLPLVVTGVGLVVLAVWARIGLTEDDRVDCGGVGVDGSYTGETPEDAVIAYMEATGEGPWARTSPRFGDDAEFVPVDGQVSELDALTREEVGLNEWRVTGGCVTEPPPAP